MQPQWGFLGYILFMFAYACAPEFFHKLLHQILLLDCTVVRLILYCNILSVIEMYTMRLIDNHYLKYLFGFYLVFYLYFYLYQIP